MVDIPHAIFGEVDHAHDVRGHCGVDRRILAAVQSATDLPPHGGEVSWNAFVAGYPLKDVFAVQRTMPDPNASRSGMVRSHVAFLNWDIISEVRLDRVFEELDPFKERDEWKPLKLEVVPASESAAPDGTRAVVESLVQNGEANWCDEDTFENVVACVWDCLANSDRARLTFGLLFHPEAQAYPQCEDPLGLWLVPPEVSHRWMDKPILGRESIEGDRYILGSAIMGEERGAQIRELARKLCIEKPTVHQWRTLSRLSPLVQDLDDLGTDGTRAAAQQVARIEVECGERSELVQTILDALAERTLLGGLEEVSALRAISWKSFRDGPEIRRHIVEQWVRDRFDGISGRNDKELFRALRLATSGLGGDVGDDLREAVVEMSNEKPERATEIIIENVGGGDGVDIFTWMSEQAQFDIDRHVRMASEGEVSVLPTSLRETAVDQGWAHVHALSCSEADPRTAWREHLGLEGASGSSMRLLARVVGMKATVETAALLRDEDLISLAGSLVSEDASVMDGFDSSMVGWLEVWSAAVEAGASLWIVEGQRENNVWSVLDRVQKHDCDVTGLLERFAQSEFANLACYPDRRVIWSLIPEELRDRYLSRTAIGVATKLDEYMPIESELRKTLFNLKVFRHLVSQHPESAVDVVIKLDGDRRYVNLVVGQASLGRSKARMIGKLVRERGWGDIADRIMELALSGRSDLVPAAQECRALLGAIDSIKLRFLVVSDHSATTGDLERVVGGEIEADEFWAAVHELMTGLYERGPNDREIWDRAGGERADLPTGKTGRERWRKAIEEIRNGGRGAPSSEQLLETVVEDHPRNEEAQLLYEVTEGEG